jgi:predicted DNA-binding WGR domain protein
MNNETPLKQTLWFVGENFNVAYGKKPVKSDKVYVLELFADGSLSHHPALKKPVQTLWTVKASWGRRGKAFQSQIKLDKSRSYWWAKQKFDELLEAKIAKGYKKWEFAPEVSEMHYMTDYDS